MYFHAMQQTKWPRCQQFRPMPQYQAEQKQNDGHQSAEETTEQECIMVHLMCICPAPWPNMRAILPISPKTAPKAGTRFRGALPTGRVLHVSEFLARRSNLVHVAGGWAPRARKFSYEYFQNQSTPQPNLPPLLVTGPPKADEETTKQKGPIRP